MTKFVPHLLRGARVYLSGPMDFVASRTAEKDHGWRQRVGDFLRRLGVTVFDPWFKPEVRGLKEYGREDETTTRTREEWTFAPGAEGAAQRARCAERFWPAMHIDLRMVDTSDFLVAYCPTNIYSVGTPHEIIVCRQQRKPVLFVSPRVTFPTLEQLRRHLDADGDRAGLELLERLAAEAPLKPNPAGVPSLWYLPLVGGEHFFDGFGFAAYRQDFDWPATPLDEVEAACPPQKPLLAFLASLNDALPQKWDRSRKAFVPNDDWLLWDLRDKDEGGAEVFDIHTDQDNLEKSRCTMDKHEANLSTSVSFLRKVFKAPPNPSGGLELKTKTLAIQPDATILGSRLRSLSRLGIIAEKDIDALRAQSDGGYEAIIGANNLLPAWFLDVGARLSRAVCLVRASGVNYRGESGSWMGTGFLLSPSILLTNHHVLNSPDVAAAAECVFNYQAGPDGQMLPTRNFRCRPQRLFLTSPTVDGLDYTFVWVDGDPGKEFGCVPVNRGALHISLEEVANIISHPAGQPKSVTIQENHVKWQDEIVVHYTSDTEHGSSGAGVFSNEWKPIALHHASKDSEVKGYDYLNEGIKLSAIATSLETRASADRGAAEVLRLFQGSDETMGFFGALGRKTGHGSGLEIVVNSYHGEADDIDVGFWNIEWFCKNYEEKVAAVAEVMVRMNLDIWSLEESSPNAAAALVKHLKSRYGLDFDYEAAEPNAVDNKQSCTVLWNTKTVQGRREEWGQTIETWLQADSREFCDLGLEAVEGKIFDRYPALLRFEAPRPAGDPFTFFLVPLHLKAMDEGSKRRQMASKIMAAAIKQKINDGADGDWVLGGDYNAPLASEDFQAMIGGGFEPLSADDEESGAFSYIKRPHQSLIDHIFLSPNLARRFGKDDYFIVAAERTFPHYVEEVSDHRPVLVRLSLKSGEEAAPAPAARGGPEASARPSAAMQQLRKMLNGAEPAIPPIK